MNRTLNFKFFVGFFFLLDLLLPIIIIYRIINCIMIFSPVYFING